MTKTRVPHVCIFWTINSFGEVVGCRENNCIDFEKRFDIGNYFNTKEEAEAMEKKIKAVLNGADVIKMPSGEDLVAARKSSCPYPEDYGQMPRAFRQGWDDCFNWMYDKIVK